MPEFDNRKIKRDFNTLKSDLENKRYTRLDNFVSSLTIDYFLKLTTFLSDTMFVQMIANIGSDISSKILILASQERKNLLFDSLPLDKIKIIIKELYPDELVEVIKGLNTANSRKTDLVLTPKTKEQVIEIMRSDEETVASIINPSFVSITPNITIGRVLLELKDQLKSKELSKVIYVISDDDHFLGYISLKDILSNHAKNKVSDFIKKPISLDYHESIEAAINLFRKYHLDVLPIVDGDKILGIITSSDIVDDTIEEYSEDVQKQVAIVPLERSYLKTTAFKVFRSRVFWLFLLLFSASLSQMLIEYFQQLWGIGQSGQGILASSIATTAFTTALAVVPLITDTVGNAGSQVSSTIVRSLATQELKVTDWKLIIKKEMGAATYIGFTLAIGNFLRMLLVWAITNKLNMINGRMLIAGITSFALIITIYVSKFVGGILPLVAVKLKIDPASMSVPLITTIADILAILIYFSLITAFFLR